MADATRMILYARVSTDDEKQEGSLDKQIERMTYACNCHEFTRVVEFKEEASGKDIKNRPKMQLALKMLENGEADGIMVCDLSRLTRDVGDIHTLFKSHFNTYRLYCIQEMIDTYTPMGRCMGVVITAFNQMFREVVKDKTKAAMTKRRKAGMKYTSRVFGWKVGKDGLLEEDKGEQLCLGRIMELYALAKTPYQIASILVREGYKTAKQLDGTNPLASWTGTTVERIVNRELKRRKEMTNG